MEFNSNILKKEKLSKTAEKEKKSLIEDFSKLMDKCCTYPVTTDEELDEVIRMCDDFSKAHNYNFAGKLSICLLDEVSRQMKKRKQKNA